MEQETIIIVSCFGAAAAVLLILVLVLFSKLSGLRRRLEEIQETGFVRVQKLKLENDKNHAFHNPAISPDEELARRGFSMYSPEDVESGRPTERYSRLSGNRNNVKVTLADIIRKSNKKPDPPVKPSAKGTEMSKQTGGQFVEELAREIDFRHQRQAYNDKQQDYEQRNSMPRQNSTLYPQSQSQQNQQANPPPPFLLQSIEENKRRSRSFANPVANNNGRSSETNPNFIY